MGIGTYSQLTASIADTLNRQDLTAVIPTFISLCEADMNRRVRVRDNLVRVMVDLDSRYLRLPTDWREAEFMGLICGGRDYPLRFQDQRQMLKQRALTQGTPGFPEYYSLTGDSIEVCPVPDTTYVLEMGYWAAIPALSDDAPSNWLLTKYPAAYLYGSLIHSAPYLKEDERMQLWGSLFAREMDSISQDDDAAKFSGSTPYIAMEPIG